jgi:hypothetical protein
MESIANPTKVRSFRSLFLFVISGLLTIGLSSSAFADGCCGSNDGCPPKHKKVKWTFTGGNVGDCAFLIRDGDSVLASGSQHFPVGGPPPFPIHGELCVRMGKVLEVEVVAKSNADPGNPSESMTSIVTLKTDSCKEEVAYWITAKFSPPETVSRRGVFFVDGGECSARGQKFGQGAVCNGSVNAEWSLGANASGQPLEPLFLELTSLGPLSRNFDRVVVPKTRRPVTVPFYEEDEVGQRISLLELKFNTSADPDTPEGLAEINANIAGYMQYYLIDHPYATWDPNQVVFGPLEIEVVLVNGRTRQIVVHDGLVDIEELSDNAGYFLRFFPSGFYGAQTRRLTFAISRDSRP